MYSNKFEGLSCKQRKAIETLAGHMDWSQMRVAQEVGIHYTTLSKWMSLPVFRQALDERLHERFKEAVRPAIECINQLIEQGDRQAAIYVLDNCGYELPKQVELDTPNGITINIVE